jgi:hypothetical protein
VRTLCVAAGIALAGLVGLVGLSLSGIAARLAIDPSVGSGPGAAITVWTLFAMLAGGAVLANWLVWIGAQPVRGQ